MSELDKLTTDALAAFPVVAWLMGWMPALVLALTGVYAAFRLYNEVMKAVDRKRARGSWF